jgi:hypothetical protein
MNAANVQREPSIHQTHPSPRRNSSNPTHAPSPKALSPLPTPLSLSLSLSHHSPLALARIVPHHRCFPVGNASEAVSAHPYILKTPGSVRGRAHLVARSFIAHRRVIAWWGKEPGSFRRGWEEGAVPGDLVEFFWGPKRWVIQKVGVAE